MFFHNFKYALKTLFQNKALIFWTFAFPIILGTFFSMAFRNIENSEMFEVMDIAVVSNLEFQNHNVYPHAFSSLSDDTTSDQLFCITYVDEIKEAEELLIDDRIIGYFFLKEDSPQIVVRKNGVYPTIFKYVVEQITQSETMIQNILKQTMVNDRTFVPSESFYHNLYQDVLRMLSEENDMIQSITDDHLSYIQIEYYTLIAMACLYGGILGMVVINQILPNMSTNGKRVSVSPSSKAKLIFSGVLASYFAQLLGLLLLFLYTIFVLHVDYGEHFAHVILLSIVGSFAGLSLGIFVSSVFRTNENVKTGIVLSFTMLGCFLSGMMGVTMKYIIDKNVPIVNKFNPASMITDGFYSLYYYDTFDRFYFNVLCLLIFAFVLLFISIFCLRRQKYDSI